MASSVRRHAAHPALILAVLAASGLAATGQTLHVEFMLFSGRPRPSAEIADGPRTRAILDTLAVRIAAPVPCSEVPAMPSTPAYAATLLLFGAPVAGSRTLTVRDGYIHSDSSLPCYRDPGSNLEKLAVATAFLYPDQGAPGGPRPMAYLACLVPDSLHADILPCATGLPPPPRRGIASAPADAGPAPRFGLDGRSRSPGSPQILLERPSLPRQSPR